MEDLMTDNISEIEKKTGLKERKGWNWTVT